MLKPVYSIRVETKKISQRGFCSCDKFQGYIFLMQKVESLSRKKKNWNRNILQKVIKKLIENLVMLFRELSPLNKDQTWTNISVYLIMAVPDIWLGHAD